MASESPKENDGGLRLDNDPSTLDDDVDVEIEIEYDSDTPADTQGRNITQRQRNIE